MGLMFRRKKILGELSENIPVSSFMFWITELFFFFFGSLVSVMDFCGTSLYS